MAYPILKSFCTVEEAAKIVGVHRSQISRYINRGYLNAERIGNQLFLPRRDVETFQPPGQGRRDFQKIEN